MSRPILAALLSVSGTTLSDEEKRLFEKYNPLGVTLFNRNLQSASQIKALGHEIRACLQRDDVVIALDAEGGRVNRLKAAGFPDYAFQKTLAQTHQPELAGLHARMIAADMLSVGANMNFAPVLDVESVGMTEALQGRCFGADKEQIVTFGRQMIDTYISAGICPCIKHMPGHGRAQTDPHLGLPIIEADPAALATDFYPFQALNDCPAAMTAHIVLKEIDPVNPITLSARGIKEIIRQRIGFKGLLISDGIDMRALKGSAIEKAQACWQAGCDVVCYCFGQIAEMQELCQGGKYLSDQSLERFATVKNVWLNHSLLNVLDRERKRYYSAVKQIDEEKIRYDATEILHQMQQGEC